MPTRGPSVQLPTYVTVFGAGVAGLTVAHELVERGFRVQVWEPQSDDRYPARGCDVGGLARTQWSRAHWPEWMDPANEPMPRVGRLPYEFRLMGRGWRALGPRGTGDEPEPLPGSTRKSWSVAETLEQLATDTALEEEGAVISVIARYTEGKEHKGPPPDVSVPLLKLLAPWKPTREGKNEILARPPRHVPIRFRLLTRPERQHRLTLKSLQRVKLRLELYYRPTWGVRTQPIEQLPQRFYFRRTNDSKEDAVELTAEAVGAFGGTGFDQVASELASALGKNATIEQVYMEVYRKDWVKDGDDKSLWGGWDLGYAQAIVEVLRRATKDHEIGEPCVSEDRERLDICAEINGHLVDFTAVRLDTRPPGTPLDVDVALAFRVRERWFPGEHGYRFFPAFYKHLFDTMSRTPILTEAPKSPIAASQERAVGINADDHELVETGRSTIDNLVERAATIDGSAARPKPYVLSRKKLTSLAEARDRLEVILSPRAEGGLGLNDREGIRVFLYSLKYMTSCAARRSRLEEISWADYIGMSSFGDEAQYLISNFPKALVAMEAFESDARTIGSVGTQLMLDQILDRGSRDGALDGPTSTVWLDHWRRYLEAQGVEFIHGRLESLHLRKPQDDPERQIIWPKVSCYEPLYFGLDEKTGEAALSPGYFVLALPAVEIQRIAKGFLEEVREGKENIGHRDLEAAANLKLGDPESLNPDGELRHYAGLQFYFWEDLHWIDGHTYYPESPWAITTVSQTRRWLDRPDWEHGYRGILSVILGRFDAPGRTVKKIAWECSPDEIAKEVWYQIRRGLGQGRNIPEPVFWHFDENYRWVTDPENKHAKRWVDTYPYHIQTPGNWKARPGDLEQGFAADHGVVLAGTYTKTHTRVTSMEAANESARHAVNAILRDSEAVRRVVECDIYPFEEREHPDLDAAVRLDEKLFERDLPHAFDILDIDLLAKEMLRGGPCDPLNPNWLFSRVLDTLARRRTHSASSQGAP